jgi:predicted short-subunit dehydrogenase-like oxidoreductase (DUF2520 family)
VTTVRIVGAGRAGRSLAKALDLGGWRVTEMLDLGDPVTGAADGVDVLVVSVPDGAVADVAAEVVPDLSTLVVHLAGSLTLDALAPHPRRASLHPLVPLPDPDSGAARLRGAWMALAGDPGVESMAAVLGGRAIRVADEHRAVYHAAAAIASNHLVALLGQVERVAAAAGVPLAAYLDLAGAALADVARLGPGAALTGPVSRGDWDTVRRHVAALPADERPAYLALAAAAARLAGTTLPADVTSDSY